MHSHKNCYEMRCNQVSEPVLLQMSWTSKVAIFINVCFIGFFNIFMYLFGFD